jgi:catechol 2,3-dioxygenase-like lactoylglutathione lyase family enzyme
MIGYTCVGTNDLARATAFYDDLLSLIGAKRFFETERGIGWGVAPEQPMFSVMKPFDGQAASVGNGVMVAFTVKSSAQVDSLHARALTLGGCDEGPPGLRGGNFYAAYFRDLDGNKLAVFCILSTPS